MLRCTLCPSVVSAAQYIAAQYCVVTHNSTVVLCCAYNNILYYTAVRAQYCVAQRNTTQQLLTAL